MPVTARLSKLFYERLGEEVANELVDWFNLVDSTYRSDLRELNELNFARFDAKVGQRLAELEARLERRFLALEAKVDTKLDAAVGQHAFAQFDLCIGQLDAKIDQRASELRAELIKWMFLFWTGTVLPLGALILALR